MTTPASAPSAGNPSGFAALRYREFSVFLVSKLLAFSAYQMLIIALGYQIYDLTGDAMALAYLSLVLICPTFCFALLTGYVSDRFDRRAVMSVGYGGMALASAGLWLISHSGLVVSSWVYVALFVNGTARAFANPATTSIIPNLVPQDCFANAVTWNTVTTRATQIGGPALGGIIYLLGPEVVYALAAVFCAVGALGILLIAPRRPPSTGKKPGVGELFAGVTYVYKNKIIMGAVLLDLIIILSASVIAVLPIIAKDVLAVGPAGAGILRSAMAAGGLTTALAMTHLPVTRQAGMLMFTGAALLAVSAVVVGLSTWFPLTIAAMAFMGMADMFNVNIRHTLMQIATPDNMRGRVSAVALLAAGSATELGGFRASAVAALIGVVPSIVAGGFVGLALIGLCWKFFPTLARVQRADRID
jgi:MFS family permease